MGRWHYPRWRRVVMQLALCAMLAGSVALAQLVTNHRRSNGSMRLAGIRWFGRVGVKAPLGWSLESVNQGPVLLIAQEPQRNVDGVETGGRQLVVRRTQLDGPVPAEEYLKSSGLLRGTRPLEIEGTDPGESISIAGSSGILKPVMRPVGLALFSPPAYVTEWIGCVVRPNGLALTLQLDCPDADDPEQDKQCLRNVAIGIEVRDALPSQSVGDETILR